jgi:hypothetical protein
MKFIADENISQSLIKDFQNAGHDIFDIKRANQRLSDIQITKLALLSEDYFTSRYSLDWYKFLKIDFRLSAIQLLNS